MSAASQNTKHPAPKNCRPAPGWRLVSAELAAGRTIVGIDEVGRGAWAGPVTAAAVILPPRARLDGLNDSKLLSVAARHALDRRIRRLAVAVGVGWVSVAEINANGLGWATRQSGLRALADLGLVGQPSSALAVSQSTRVILDGKHDYLKDDPSIDSVAHVKADLKIAPVAAASIIAKVARDNYLIRLAARHSEYGFENNKGYPSPHHIQALRDTGVTLHHRTCWKPFSPNEDGGFRFGEFATAADYAAWLDELDAA